MPAICHFEIPANDVNRANKFYKEVFDWGIEKVPEMDYWLTSAKTIDGKEGLGGGIYKRMKDEGIAIYIDSNDIESDLIKIEKAGGKTIQKKTAIKGIGYFAVFEDTEGNVFSLYSSDENAK